MKICSSCHSLIEDDAVICPNCGAEQRHFPKGKPATPRTKRSRAAARLILPSILVVALMGAVLAFALRTSQDEPTETTVTTTEKPDEPLPDESYITGDIVCSNGSGSYSYHIPSRKLSLNGSGELSASASGDPPWQHYLNEANTIEIIGFSEIAPETFRGCPELLLLQIEPMFSDVSVGEYAFADCEQLQYVEMEKTVNSISSHSPQGFLTVQLGEGVFSNCPMLSSVDAMGVSEIGENVFEGVPMLSELLVSDLLVRMESELTADSLMLLLDEGTALHRAVWEKLLRVCESPMVFVANIPLLDYNDCPIKDE